MQDKSCTSAISCYIETMSTHDTRQQLLDEMAEFFDCYGHRISRHQFGLEIAGRGDFVSRLEGGKDLRVATLDKVRKTMDAKRREFATRDGGC